MYEYTQVIPFALFLYIVRYDTECSAKEVGKAIRLLCPGNNI
jgi:hypothetical protein